MSDGALGYDAYARAIVCPFGMDEANPRLRKTVFDFRERPRDPKVSAYVVERPKPDGSGTEFAWRLDPGKAVLVGIGFFTSMPDQFGYWVAPRSGLASKHRITVTNAPGTVDPDYRGEAGVAVCNMGEEPFYLTQEMRIAQNLFVWFVFPNFVEVASPDELPASARGAGGFGSTGFK
jgi:dUTP pyrophosphatase